jgi:hypothetical protein
MEIKNRYTGETIQEVEGASLFRANLYGADLRRAYLYGADLRRADLRRADLYGADLREVYLCGADLQEADLRGANLSGANLQGANLSGAYLREAYLQEADLRGANLQGAYLSMANLQGAYLSMATYGEGVPLTREPIQTQGLPYSVLIMDTHMKIGCELHTFDEWAGFTDKEILAMDGKDALKFWRSMKKPLMSLCESRES